MADTNRGRKVYICATVKPSDLTQEQFEALTWVQVGKVGNVGDFGKQTNIVSYTTLDTEFQQKSKGISNAGDPVIECARSYNDAGQILMRTAGAPTARYSYALKIEENDKPTADYTNTIHYVRGKVAGPVNLGGGNEDFVREQYTVGLEQVLTVDPEAGSAPTNTVLPSIVGTAVQVGVVLTAIEGEWTGDPSSFAYQWQHDASGNGTFADVASGGTSRTYTPVVGDIADSMRVQVTATNGAGTSSAASSLGTIPIIAA